MVPKTAEKTAGKWLREMGYQDAVWLPAAPWK